MADSVARLPGFAESYLRDAGVTQVRVEALGDSVEYEPSERTRAFYRGMGFSEFKPVMADNPGMPESLTLQKTTLQRSGDWQSGSGVRCRPSTIVV